MLYTYINCQILPDFLYRRVRKMFLVLYNVIKEHIINTPKGKPGKIWQRTILVLSKIKSDVSYFNLEVSQ